MSQLSPRAKRLIRAGDALFGDRWHTAMARATGLSQTYITIMASGARPVTDEVEKVLLKTLQQERKRLRAVSSELADIIHEITEESQNA
jgi:hypothetical protein